MTPFPRIGQIWAAVPRGSSPPCRGERYVLIVNTDEKQNRIAIRKVEKQNGQWTIVGRRSTARLSRFDGSYWNYGFVEFTDILLWR
jgi:hypothetical protein